ncbi:hypothetical protein ACVGV5_00165, partial [Enterobacter sichuanensis]
FLIGASSYGELIFPGIYLNDFPTLILGAPAPALYPLIHHSQLAALGRVMSPYCYKNLPAHENQDEIE